MESDGLFDSTPASSGVGSSDTDIKRMTTAWKNEKAAPDILPYESDLVERLRSAADDMEGKIFSLSSDSRKVLEVQLMTMEVDRVKHLLKSYLRCRLMKIDRFFLHIFGNQEYYDRLSDAEREYAQRVTELTQHHMDASVLSKMPERYDSMMKQSESSSGMDMIPEPPINDFVFCQARNDIENVVLDEEKEDSLTLEANQLHVIRYKPISNYVKTKQLELL